MANSHLTYVGTVLREYRMEARLSQEQLADRLDVTRNYIYLLESGRSYPSLGTLIRLARALGVRPGAVLDAIAEREEKHLRQAPAEKE